MNINRSTKVKNKKINSTFIIICIIIMLTVSAFSLWNYSIINGGIQSIIAAKINKQYASLDTTLTDRILPSNYGDWAEYEVDLNDDGLYTNDWKIFYNDGTNVFLIAADYLKNSKIPENAGMSTAGEYNVYWDAESNFANKEGIQDIPQDVANQFMLKKYKEQYGEVTDINSKATAVLLDTDIWEDFAAGFEGSFAYGSPTVEMWVASWNQKGYGKLQDGISTDTHSYTFECYDLRYTETFETEGYGYRVGNLDENLQAILNISSDSKGYNDVLYFPHTSKIDESDRYFLASPTYRGYTSENNCRYYRDAECVRGNTEILVSTTGETVKAEDLKVGDNIVCYDVDTETNKVGKVVEVYVQKQAENFVKYTFDDGTYLEVTDYHDIYTTEGFKNFAGWWGNPIPEIGDEVKTFDGFKKITGIKEYNDSEDYYDFSIQDEEGYGYNSYYANDTLVSSSYLSGSYSVHYFTDYMMDCLVSCSYEGDIGLARMDVARSNSAIRPIVVLPTTAIGYKDDENTWHLGEELGRLVVHHYLEDAEEQVKIAEDEITENLTNGQHYVTSELSPEKYDTDKYEYTGRHTGDEVEGEIIGGQTKEVTYWYRIRKHIIATEVKGTGGHITGEGKEKCEEVVHLEDSKSDIVITPDDGYYVKSVTINGQEADIIPNPDGTYSIAKFEKMVENKLIVVEFAKYGSITITKVDSRDENIKLPGAEFKLEKLKDVNGELVIDDSFVAIVKETMAEPEQLGKLQFTELKHGTYRLTEVKAPEGYHLLREPIEIELTENSVDYNAMISNRQKTQLPATGGEGRVKPIIYGLLIIFIVTRLKIVIVPVDSVKPLIKKKYRNKK